MSFLSEFDGVKNKTLVLSFISIMLLFTPGIFSIFLFNQELFFKLDFSKLLLLSISLVSPFILLNFFLASELIEKEDGKISEEHQFNSLILSILISGFIIYTVLIVSFFIQKNASWAINTLA